MGQASPSTWTHSNSRNYGSSEIDCPRRAEAASAGFYTSPGWGTSHPRVQLISIAEALAGKRIDYPHHTATTFNVAPKAGADEDDRPPQEEQLFEA